MPRNTLLLQVKRVQPEAVAIVARAAELFMGTAAEQAAKVAAGHKRRTVKLEDVAVLLNRDKRWNDMGLKYGNMAQCCTVVSSWIAAWHVAVPVSTRHSVQHH